MKLRAMVALAAAMIGAVFLSPAAHAAPAPGYPPHGCPGQLSVSTTHPLPGETITVTGTNFRADARVHLVMHTTTYDLGTFTANAQGHFTAEVRLPRGVAGNHVILATSGAAHIRQCAGQPIQIHRPGGVNAQPPGHGTSFTGIDILIILLVAAGLLGAGVALTRSGKRRRGAEAG